MRWSRVRSGPVPALLLVTAVALLARLWNLGWRVAHQDEGRVAHWTLHYMETGIWEYRPIIHGPFLPHVDGIVFTLLGANDFTMRLIVALFGALLPLGALLFRDRLRDSEVIGLGLFLAFNPLVLYYSRFFRNDVLTVGFMFLALGCFVRAYDRRRLAYLYAGVASFALAFTTKELAFIYPVTWAGAAALLLDHRLTMSLAAGDGRLRDALPAPVRTAGGWARATGRAARRGDGDRLADRLRAAARPAGVGLLAAVEFLAIIVLFYAPRSRGIDRPGLWKAFGEPTTFPAVIRMATVDTWAKFVGQWGDSASGHAYIPYFQELGSVLVAGALPLAILAVAGFLLDRYAGERPRDVVAFCFYWGAAFFVGFPIAVDNPFPWEVVHYVVPLAVPAAVALSFIYRRGRRGIARDDPTLAVAAAVLLVIVGAQVAVTAIDTSYRNPQSPENELVQYAQPAGEMQPTLREIRSISAEHGGVDVLFYGDREEDGCGHELYQPTEEWESAGTPPCGWFSRLPIPWYLDTYDATVSSTTEAADVGSDPPPVVIALGDAAPGVSNTAGDIGFLEDRGYERYTYQQYQHSRPMVFFVDPSAPGTANATA